MLQVLAMLMILFTLAPAEAQELRSGPYRRAYCTLFEHRDMQGASIRLPNGERMTFNRPDVGSNAWRERPRWNDAVSSATIDPGCRLQIWEHAMAGGESRVWHGGQRGLSVNYVGDRWNDRVSAVACYCN
jgi:hypothetical protein